MGIYLEQLMSEGLSTSNEGGTAGWPKAYGKERAFGGQVSN